jgi:hypothetical protein
MLGGFAAQFIDFASYRVACRLPFIASKKPSMGANTSLKYPRSAGINGVPRSLEYLVVRGR